MAETAVRANGGKKCGDQEGPGVPRGKNVVPAVEDLHRVALALIALRTADG